MSWSCAPLHRAAPVCPAGRQHHIKLGTSTLNTSPSSLDREVPLSSLVSGAAPSLAASLGCPERRIQPLQLGQEGGGREDSG